MGRHKISLEVNGIIHNGEVESRLTLADYLREDLDLTGTHLGCEHGVCGVCTVLVNQRPARSCLMLAAQADGLKITTIEGVGSFSELHPVQEAFRQKHGTQCGFCTPAFVLTTLELVQRPRSPTPEEINNSLSGILCRCTGYVNILEAVNHILPQTKAGPPHE
jgi:carbon-monoxide dehydrogenase small subunit